MSDSDFQPEGIGQGLQVLLKRRGARWVAAAAITQDEQLAGCGVVAAPVMPPPTGYAIARKPGSVVTRAQIDAGFVQAGVVQAMRHDFAFAIAGEIVIPHGQRLPCVEFAVAVKIAEHLFLLGIHGEHRLSGGEVRGLQCRDVFKLGIALGMLFERFLLLRLPTNKAVLLQQLTNNPATHPRARRTDAPGYFRLA